MKIPKSLSRVIDSFEKLPGIGPKTAQRLSYYLLHVPQRDLESFASAIENLKKNTVMCSVCKNVSDTEPCPVCDDASRDVSQIMVVEQPLDLMAFERTGKYSGVYHVLHGVIDPLNNIGPDEIFIGELIARVRDDDRVQEVTIATNPTMEGEATAMYIQKRIKEVRSNGHSVSVTRLGVGIPTGADLEYADDMTLMHAFEGRRELL